MMSQAEALSIVIDLAKAGKTVDPVILGHFGIDTVEHRQQEAIDKVEEIWQRICNGATITDSDDDD